jgi:glyoxylase-like metal-dependent hydrolase (beta-lactamase superfamily II)
VNDGRETKRLTRRELVRRGAVLAGGTLLAPAWPLDFAAAGPQAAATPADPVAAMRAQMGAAPIETLKLSDQLTMLSGPGGNVIVLHGPDGKFVVDTFVLTAWDKLKETLYRIDGGPIQMVIDTHWHFDHADNNANLRKVGAPIVAHENTRKRLTETHVLPVLGMRFDPAPPEALPTQTFSSTHKLYANGEELALGYIRPAHTDTDIYIHYVKAGVLHMGDVFFNGMYPYIDSSTGGSMNGMIAGADMGLKLAGARTKIVPGHGPLGDRAALTKFRDVLVAVRDRVQKLKTAGRTLDEVIAANPIADFDPTWGKGFFQGKTFLAIAYNAL